MATVFLVIRFALALTFAAAGVLALVTGRIAFSWLRRSVHRPGIWGAGALLLGTALGLQPVLPFEVQIPLMILGLLLIGLSQLWWRRRVSGTD
ncbi:hypothetical protein [Streptomyces sp. NBC_00690]|uniref:hypothetical protein n=1 Tax=Streptomyces sp. NBC_00690 TaxID=2975808 RepID=UPI002E29463D|nr:hypothetical protein [Streptomyces sp. NBC_00690]